MPSMVNAAVTANADRYAKQFNKAEPFRHVVIDDFFGADAAAALLTQFPDFERGNARTENGTLGNKSTVEAIRELGPAYAALDDVVQSRDFLDLIGRITGIPALLYDPHYFGGGTHLNRAGQDLDPHVDFNRHPIERWYRRLNLIVYLNHVWDDAWGGSFELHSDPRAPDDRVSVITPLYNRCVIFETTESSWHGFKRIAPPPEHADATRKSIALYFYTREAPAAHGGSEHSTIYVERPLPDRFTEGRTLDDGDVRELAGLIARRDQHLERLYRNISELTTELEQTRAALYAGRLGRLRHLLRSIRAQMRR